MLLLAEEVVLKLVVPDTEPVAQAEAVAVTLLESVGEPVCVGLPPASDGVACRGSVKVALGESVAERVGLAVAPPEGEAGKVVLELGEGDGKRMAVGDSVSVLVTVM